MLTSSSDRRSTLCCPSTPTTKSPA
jgi:hypothetical protein